MISLIWCGVRSFARRFGSIFVCSRTRFAVLGPHRPVVEGLQGSRAGRHVGKAPEPDEAVRIVEIAEPSDQPDPHRFLALDECPVEELEQDVSLPRLHHVLPELDDHQLVLVRA
jgi:hypothetical protein